MGRRMLGVLVRKSVIVDMISLLSDLFSFFVMQIIVSL
jgi:hypothetical protein